LAALIAGAPASGTEGVPVNAATLLALALHLPLFLMFWHAPALVHWHGVTPAKSLFFSVVAVVRNFGAHVVYSLAWGAVFMVVGSVLGVAAGLVGGPSVAQAVMMPTALLLAAMFSTSIYFSFQACFSEEAQAPQPAPATPAE
ncbi:MAG: BPSS1780 family membrane protein, partial [Ramlibacter sp.]